MMKEGKAMMRLAGLDSQKHRGWKLHRARSYEHMAGYHSVAVGGWEMGKVALNYPIVFERIEEDYRPVALLSLVKAQNQYLDGAAWRANYVPAAVRVYPFRLEGDQVLIDESAPHFEQTEAAEALFDERGGPTPVLNEAMIFLRKCQQEEIRTKQLCKRLKALDLFSEQNLEIISPLGKLYRVVGFYGIDSSKIDKLSDEHLAALAREGALDLVRLQQLSLEHLGMLAAQRDRKWEPEVATESMGNRKERELEVEGLPSTH